ncbi:sodium:proton antiporter, partial [Campylobacter sp. MRC_CM3]
MSLLCLFRFNVLLSLLISALVAGMLDHMPLTESMNVLIDGMQGNLKTALSYVILGAIAAAISRTQLTAYLIKIVSHFISHKKYLLILSIALISCFSQNLVPIHVAFIPLLIPPLLSLFNRLKIDRRAVACALTFGLTTPYMVLPVGFGLTFQDLLRDNLEKNGINVTLNDVTHTMYFAAICMIAGLFLAIFVFYRKPK